MRTLRLTLAGAVILALLGGLSGAVVAQMDADADAVYMTQVSEEPVSADIGSVSETDTLYSSRDGLNVSMVESSDPRVSGKTTIAWNVDVDPETGQGIMWGTSRIENDGGTWEGPWTGMEYEPGEADYFTVSGWLTGDGDYAGYTHYFQVDAYQYTGEVRKAHGVIFKGQPPVPELPAE